MAQSVKIDFNVWSQFDHHAYEIMTEDFVHNNLFKFNANILTDKGRVRLQETLSQKEAKLDTTGEANIWFPLVENKSLYFQCRPKGFRVHFDNGLFARGHLLHNFYTSVESDRNLSDHLFKIGCETIAQKWRYNLRYRYNTHDAEHTLYSRWRYDYNNWTFEGIKAFGLANKILLKNNLLIGYYQGNKTFHLRLENEGWRTEQINLKTVTFQDIFDYATFNFTKTLNANDRVGFEASMKTTGRLRPFSVVWQTYDPILHTNLKIKASSDYSGAVSIRNKVGTYGNYVLGIGIKEIGSSNKVNFGILFDLNL